MAKRGFQGRWTAFSIATGVAVLTILDIAKVNVTLAPIQTTLGAGSADIQLIVAGYVLAYGITLVPAGRLGDLWSRRALFLIGLAAFIVASLVCALAWSPLVLVIGRLLQGVTAGILMPQVLGLIQQLFIGADRGRAFGIFGAAIGIGTAFGPTVGGLLIGALGDDLGWRWTFGMNVPLAIIAFVFAVWLMPKQQDRVSGQQLDLVGTSLLALTVLAVMLPFVLTSGEADDNPARWWFLALAVVLLVAFLWWERRYLAAGKTPVVDLSTFKKPSYRNGVVIITLMFAALSPVFLVFTLFLMEGLGHAAVVAGLVSVPYALASAVAAASLGRFSHKYGATVVLLGVIVYTVGMIGALVLSQVGSRDAMPVLLSICMLVAGVGGGAIMGANQARTLKHVPVTQAGIAGSFAQVGQRVGTAVGVAIITSIYFAGMQSSPDRLTAARSSMGAGMTYVLVVLAIVLVVAIADRVASMRRAGVDTAAIELVDRAHLEELADDDGDSARGDTRPH